MKMSDDTFRLRASEENGESVSVNNLKPFNQRDAFTFRNWWETVGKFYDPDTEDVSWFDKRKALAEQAFEYAKAVSRNYVASSEIYPEKVIFANGRTVGVCRGMGDVAYLEVAAEEK